MIELFASFAFMVFIPVMIACAVILPLYLGGLVLKFLLAPLNLCTERDLPHVYKN